MNLLYHCCGRMNDSLYRNHYEYKSTDLLLTSFELNFHSIYFYHQITFMFKYSVICNDIGCLPPYTFTQLSVDFMVFFWCKYGNLIPGKFRYVNTQTPVQKMNLLNSKYSHSISAKLIPQIKLRLTLRKFTTKIQTTTGLSIYKNQIITISHTLNSYVFLYTR